MQKPQKGKTLKRVASVALSLVVSLCLLPIFTINSAVAEPIIQPADAADYSSLIFDLDEAYVGEATLAGDGMFPEALVYKTYEVEAYTTNPVRGQTWQSGWMGPASTPSEDFFKMYIHVPVSYGDETFDAASVAQASIMLKVNWGGDMSSAPSASSFTNDAILIKALTEGWVVVDPGMLGNTCLSTGPHGEENYNYGKAPYPMASMKAAIRYLRYDTNATVIPGDKERIFATGMSSGGCGTTILAASGNSTLFADALEELGAAPGRDDIFGTLARSPVIPRDYTDDAVAWERFFWLDFASVDTSGMSAEQLLGLEVNEGLVESFTHFESTLNLRANHSVGSVSAGDLITTENIAEYYYPYIKDSAITYLNRLGSRTAIDNYLASERGVDDRAMTRSELLKPVFAADNETVIDLEGDVETFWKTYLDYVYRIEGFGPLIDGADPTLVDYLYDKAYIAPDIQDNGILPVDSSSGYTATGSMIFGKGEDYYVTATSFGLAWIQSHQGVSVSQEYLDLYKLQKDSMNPLFFVMEDASATPAPHWFMSIGAADTVTPPVMFLNLVTGLENKGYDVEPLIEWDESHMSMYLTAQEWQQFFVWAADLPKTIDFATIEGVTAPVAGETPVTSITETDQYVGTVTWSPNDDPFELNKTYTATISLTPKAGYTLKGVPEDFFVVPGAVSTSNDADSNLITAVFQTTGSGNGAADNLPATGDISSGVIITGFVFTLLAILAFVLAFVIRHRRAKPVSVK
jgi:hypothetical protein